MEKRFPLHMAFHIQTASTVLAFLQTVSKHDDVFSACLEKGKLDIYLFSACKEIVFLGVDKSFEDELADEEPFRFDEPLYFSESADRVSPVYILHERAKQFLKNAPSFYDYHISYLLLTGSFILNLDGMHALWLQSNTAVLHQIDGVPSLSLPVRHNCVKNHKKILKALSKQKDLSTKELAETMCEILKDFYPEFSYKEINPDPLTFLSEKHAQLMKKLLDTEELPDDDQEESRHAELNLPSGSIMLSSFKDVHMTVLPPLENPRLELSKLVGCRNVKDSIDDLIGLSSYNRRLRSLNPKGKQHQMSLHAIFSGRPGTGKSTVCKIYGSLLHNAGVLSKGHVIVCDRSHLVGNSHGDEEIVVRELLQQAQGGVLMIDEAYQLNGVHPTDPGKLILPLLMSALADETQRDLAVVLCGYTDEMDRLLELNPGLQSRFPNRFDFPDFTLSELSEIARLRVKEYGYHFTRSAWLKFRGILNGAYTNRDPKTWGNARFVSNLLEHIYLRHARRCLLLPDEKLLTITAADIEEIPVPRCRRLIGFRDNFR